MHNSYLFIAENYPTKQGLFSWYRINLLILKKLDAHENNYSDNTVQVIL